MADSDLGVKVSLIPDLNPAEFQAKVNSMKLKVKVTADFSGLSESSKVIGTTSQSLSKMYDKLAKLRKSQLVDKKSVTAAERQLDILQQMSKQSKDYAKQYSRAQRMVQQAVSKNQNAKTFSSNQIKKAQQDVQKWSQTVQDAFSGKKIDASVFDSFKAQVNQFNKLSAGTKKWSQAYDALSSSYQRFTSLTQKETQRSSSASQQVKSIQKMLSEQSKMYNQLAQLRTKSLIDKKSVTDAERQLDALQNLPKLSQAYADQFAVAQKAVQTAATKNQGAISSKKIKSLQQQVDAWNSKVNNKRQFGVVDEASLAQFDALSQKVSTLTVGTKEWLSAVDALRTSYSKFTQASKNAADSSKRVTSQKEMLNNITDWETEMQRIARDNPRASQTALDEFNRNAAQFRQASTLEEQTRLYNEAARARRQYAEAVRDQSAIDVQAAQQLARSTNLNNLKSQISDYLRNTPKLQSNQTFYQQMLGLQHRAAQPDADFSALQNRFADLRAQIKALGLDTETLGHRLGRLFKDHVNTAIVMAGLHLIQSTFREIYQSVLDVDTAMTDLKKVSSATSQEYSKFLDTASNRAHDLGATVSDVIDATSEFSRLGYNLQESTQLADAALMYKNVSEYTNVTDAAQSIVSTMKAFDIEADNVQSIVDKFNEIGNNYAISSEGLGEAMQRSAASLALAGNSLDESLALVTGANEVVNLCHATQ